jgi:hypothetical protein
MNLLKTTLLVLGICTTQLTIAQDNVFKLDENYKIKDHGTVHLNTDDAKVTIQGSERPDVHVKIYRKITRKGVVYGKESFEVEVSERNGDLYIRDIQQQVNVTIVGYMSEEYEILIESPKHVNLDIEGDDDDYEIGSINGRITMNIDDGDATLTNCGGDSFKFDFDDGDLKMDKASGSLKLSLDDGDAMIRNAKFTNINVTADDADIDIATSLDDDGDYSFRMDDGNIDLTILAGGGSFQIYHDDGRVSASQAFDVQVEEDDETRLQLDNGSARIKIHTDDASIRLKSI